MGKGSNGRCVFPLTSLQIGDLQSYLSHLSLFLACDSRKFYILVDNRPWLKDLGPRPTHLWQLMVTKSRLSPFANTRRKKERKVTGEFVELEVQSDSERSKSEKLRKWFSLIDATTLSRKRALLPVKNLRSTLISNSKLHRTLYGFIVFEVSWTDVRGINYLNELQTDTSLAIESKLMRRWEFDSIAQAARCISSWFPGTQNELTILKAYLGFAIGEVFHDAEENFPSATSAAAVDSSDNVDCFGDESPCCLGSSFSLYPVTMTNRLNRLHTPPPPEGPYKRRKVDEFSHCDIEFDSSSDEAEPETAESPIHSRSSSVSDFEDMLEATHYHDVLILFRFNDPYLPFKLKEIIMSDLRLLTLLESGLPSWVIFLQSYPGFCHLYRPWMCPLARTLYVLISIVTVVIGFYDLYKNVPLLKATASGLFGPLFDWIETWEMISRIKYLGTMLFLHNSQKAIKWFFMMTRTIRSFFSVLTRPMAGPFLELLEFMLPLWNLCLQLTEFIFSIIWIFAESSCSTVVNLVEILLLPLWYLVSWVWSIASSVIYPMFWVVGEFLYAPFRLVLGLYRIVAFICIFMYSLVGDVWLSISSIFKVTSEVGSTVSSYDVSMWRSLWNDLFSQVFRALRSILNGFVAFFIACNRHRLSIYNHLKEFLRRLSGAARQPPSEGNSFKGQASAARRPHGGWQQLEYEVRSRKIR